MTLNLETRVGLFTLGGLLLLAVGTLILGDVQFKSTYRLYVYFDNADGLPVKGPVKVAGVDIGQIENIQLVNGQAKVTVQINDTVQLHRGAQAKVASTGLIGSKFLEMTSGDRGAPLLGVGEHIQGDKGFTLDDVMAQLGEFFKPDPVHGSLSDNFKATLANLRKVSQSLADSVGEQKREIRDIVLNLRDATEDARTVAADLAEVTSDRKEDVKIALAHFRSVSEKLDDLLSRVRDGDGTLARLVNDKTMSEEIKQAVSSVKNAAQDAQSVMSRISRISVYWDYRQRYDFQDARSRADAGIKIVPRPGKYYYLGGSNLGLRQDRSLPGSDLERRNTVTALLGRDFGPWSPYVGVIRSRGGVGFRLRPFGWPFWGPRIELEFEGSDFSRNETVQGVHLKGTNLSLGARVMAWDPWAWAGLRWEDVAEQRHLNATVHVGFKDDDISYLLGLVGLAGRP